MTAMPNPAANAGRSDVLRCLSSAARDTDKSACQGCTCSNHQCVLACATVDASVKIQLTRPIAIIQQIRIYLACAFVETSGVAPNKTWDREPIFWSGAKYVPLAGWRDMQQGLYQCTYIMPRGVARGATRHRTATHPV